MDDSYAIHKHLYYFLDDVFLLINKQKITFYHAELVIINKELTLIG
ncbi:hypothetical protein XBJ2_1260012 [Xenorhabdus bovienii str. Jollieti]|uniref:Uncharacterized protein n=1 Tax=Xenorhabdus bovienii (strain SS-2004) TaxID=406818 RepID=D3V1E4_XENBS|nr:hypothetical protein XBJ1_2362 [Xenorhabdus bovienii SS-2004]CDH27267.1 hypothetical protein XBJ2_1260012 [Xenorhabdus bovienii str. Jollieti]